VVLYIIYVVYIYIFILSCVTNEGELLYTPPTLSSVTYAHTNQFEKFLFLFLDDVVCITAIRVLILSFHILILLVPSAVVEHVDVYTEKSSPAF
jgi:hypothetical protein